MLTSVWKISQFLTSLISLFWHRETRPQSPSFCLWVNLLGFLCLAGLVSSGAYPGVMYQTSNGMVYAAPSSALPNGVIFSLSPQIDPGLSAWCVAVLGVWLTRFLTVCIWLVLISPGVFLNRWSSAARHHSRRLGMGLCAANFLLRTVKQS